MRFGIQTPNRADIWFEISVPPAPLVNSLDRLYFNSTYLFIERPLQKTTQRRPKPSHTLSNVYSVLPLFLGSRPISSQSPLILFIGDFYQTGGDCIKQEAISIELCFYQTLRQMQPKHKPIRKLFKFAVVYYSFNVM